MINSDRLLTRFLRYVAVHTTADEGSPTYPSTPGQLVLSRLLVEELKSIGLSDAEMSEQGIVMATVPATVPHRAPTVAFNAHVDTSPETSGENVKAQVLRNYAGGDIVLPGDPTKVITVAENPELATLEGKTLITSDGTTLLGGDDKAGLACIMELAHHLLEHPEIPHGPMRVLFTCDEEIGHGTDHVDLARLGAQVAYTYDGDSAGKVDVETFSADGAVVTVTGINTHPSVGKDKMVNALRGAGEFLARLPKTTLAPEVTDGRQGFIHPYHIDGGVAKVSIRLILRDFDSPKLKEYAAMLNATATEAMKAAPGTKIEVKTAEQYRNMGDGLVKEPRAVGHVLEAYRRLGRPARQTIIRGGTDGSQFTAKGLPTPNLASGQHSVHSPLEWACLDEMVEAVELGVEILKVWGEEKL